MSGTSLGRKAVRFLKRLFAVTLIGALAVLALLIAVPPQELIRDVLARSAGEAIGRHVTIGRSKITFVPETKLVLDEVAIANPSDMEAGRLLSVKTVSLLFSPLSLLKGESVFDTVTVQGPELLLHETAEGRRNWTLRGNSGDGGDRVPLPRTLTLLDGTVSYTSAKTGADRSATDIAVSAKGDQKTGAVHASGRFTAGGEGVSFEIALADAGAAVAGKSSALKASFDARPAKVEVSGTALFAALAEFTGDLSLSTGSLADLALWVGRGERATAVQPFKASINGKIKATTRDISFADTDVIVNTSRSRFDGRIDFAGVRPKLEGRIASQRIDLGRLMGKTRVSLAPEVAAARPDESLEIAPPWNELLAELEKLERGEPDTDALPHSPPQELGASTAPKWSEEPFELEAIKSFDLDVAISADGLAYGALELTGARLKALLSDGALEATLETVDVAQGKANGTLTLDARAAPPQASVSLTLTNVAAEPIVTEITGKPLLSGTSNVNITAKAAGQTASQLTSTLDGKARFQMGKGALRGFDVRRMISEWWRGFSFNLAMKTGFETLEAQYTIKNGVMRSQPGLELKGSEVAITSSGNVNVPERRLDQDIRIKVVPPPTALAIPVRISGDWAKPKIGIDWAGLFSSAAELDSPAAIAPAAEPPPPAVQAAIRRVLSADLPPEKLSERAKGMLRSLLPADEQP